MFDPSEPADPRFSGYGPAELPNRLDAEVEQFVRTLMSDGPTAVADVLANASERGRRVLRVYAERMASLAVRRKDREALLLGTVALVLGGLDENRPESLMVMAVLEDAAARLEVNLADVFEAASRVVGHPGTVNLVMWLSRRPEDRTLESMGFAARNDPDGFRYHLEW